MKHGSLTHWAIMAVTLALCVWVALTGRRDSNSRKSLLIAKALGISLFLNYGLYVIYRIYAGYWEVRYDLPMQLCDWSAFATAIALLTRSRLSAELSYFWVMTGSIHGILTPDLSIDFPDIRFFMFFIGHSSLMISSSYAIFGLRLYPRKGAVWRVFLFSEFYIAVALLVSYLFNGNYGYVMSKPEAGSVLDYLGDWPTYLIFIQLFAPMLFAIAYLPFKLWQKYQLANSLNSAFGNIQ
ncbi:MAG: TIGR02206 family membrane protein [Leptonema sp. (in: Bacteria)]|nr:TIGR02206 family membrane protein [Leptonema sp. (in: bacteria)]